MSAAVWVMGAVLAAVPIAFWLGMRAMKKMVDVERVRLSGWDVRRVTAARTELEVSARGEVVWPEGMTRDDKVAYLAAHHSIDHERESDGHLDLSFEALAVDERTPLWECRGPCKRWVLRFYVWRVECPVPNCGHEIQRCYSCDPTASMAKAARLSHMRSEHPELATFLEGGFGAL